MSPDRDPRFSPTDQTDDDEEFEDEEAPRSIFSATWFRVVLVVLGIGVVGAVAVPYVLDVVTPPDTPAPRTASAPPPVDTPKPPPATAPSSPPATGVVPAKPPVAAPATPPAAQAPQTTARPATPATEGAGSSSTAAPAPSAKAPAEKPAADKPVAKKAPAPEKVAAARTTAPARASENGDYYVQVGAFREQATAKRVAAQLREQNYRVDETAKRTGDAAAPVEAPRTAARPASGAPDRYDVIVSGGSSAEINTRLAAKGLASEPAGDSVRIRPSLPLRDAVALSKDLGSEGFKVQVRRGGGGSAEPAALAAAPSDSGGQTVYRVRVGGFADRATAQTVMKELQDKGFQPFIAKGRE